MIRNDHEYRVARERLEDFRDQIERMTRQLREEGAIEEIIQLAVGPTEVLAAEVESELRLYDRLRAEGVAAVPDYPPTEAGKALIALRVARGWTQRQLAEALGVSEALVSRDERNDYQGITQERHARILEALQIDEHRTFRPRRASIELPRVVLRAASFGPAARVRQGK